MVLEGRESQRAQVAAEITRDRDNELTEDVAKSCLAEAAGRSGMLASLH